MQELALRESGQHRERRLRAQRRLAPAADQLEHLHDEFDLAYAAGAELDVIGDVAALDFLADLAMQIAHRGERAVVEMAPEDERPHQLFQLGSPARRSARGALIQA